MTMAIFFFSLDNLRNDQRRHGFMEERAAGIARAMASQVIESHRAGAETVITHHRRRRCLQEEVRRASPGARPAGGPVPSGRHGGVRLQPQMIKQTVSYAGEVTAFVEQPGKMRRIAGVKTKELMLWLSVLEVYVDEASPGKVTLKTGTDLSESFDAAAFAVGE
ncbi:hypothetical protein ABZP36_009909 [Zizania latifolia]